MDEATIAAVVIELAPLIVGRRPGKIFELGPHSLAIDFGLRGEGYLFLSVAPAQPRLYLIKRRVRDLDKQSQRPGNFSLSLRKELSRTAVSSFEKMDGDRVVWIKFTGVDEIGNDVQRSLVAQLTGRSANLLLLDKDYRIIAQLREGKGAGQTVGETYGLPPTQHVITKSRDVPAPENHNSISEGLDQHYLALTASQASESRLASARAEIRKEISRRKKLLRQLESDLSGHAGAEEAKRIGDLLLANVSTAKRRGQTVTLTDYFADDAPSIEIEIDENLTLAEEASRRFESYARSKRARKQIVARIQEVKTELARLAAKSSDLENNPLTSDLPSPLMSERRQSAKAANQNKIPGTRRYLSSDDFEVLVGRAARDNDTLTFKFAKPNDLWLHAADYPGSHVIVRNPTRKEIPQRTLIEAAQLAAHFSQANKDPKVDVHYTQRKFLSKPKGVAPGLVRLQRFKNITVAPLEAGQRVK